MSADKLNIYREIDADEPRLLLGFSGWMNGGEVSTGTIKCLIDMLGAEKFAEISSEEFYIYNFPGPMEVSTIFRPHTRITGGLIKTYRVPKNVFYYDRKNNLVLFLGKEPNLKWKEYAECIYWLCAEFNIKMVYFIGSVAGLVPHTRDPRFFCSVSDKKTKANMKQYGVKFTNYKGPASIVTYLMTIASQKQIGMASIIAEIPVYIEGKNPKCIEAVTRRLSGILGLHLALENMRILGDELEKKLTEIVQARPELAAHIRKMEEDYDNEVFDTEMGDLKKWLEQQGIRVD